MILYIGLWALRLEIYLFGSSVNSDATMYAALVISWRFQYMCGFKWFKTAIAKVEGWPSSFRWIWGTMP